MVVKIITCGLGEAITISGVCHSPPTFLRSGRAVIVPCLHQVQRISLKLMTIRIDSNKVFTAEGILLNVSAAANVKVQCDDDGSLLAVVEHFGGQSQNEISSVIRALLENHQRAVVSTVTLHQIFRNRTEISSQVLNRSKTDLESVGFEIKSYVITDVTDEDGGLNALLRSRIVQVECDSKLAETSAKMEILMKESLAKEELMASKLFNFTKIAEAEKNFELHKIRSEAQVSAAKAAADLSAQLETAIQIQRVVQERLEALVVEKEQQTEVAELEVEVQRKKLTHEVRQIAETQKYCLEKLAEATRYCVALDAEATAESIIVNGNARADVILTIAKAETEQLMLKSEALKNNKDLVLVEMMLNTVPKVASEVLRARNRTGADAATDPIGLADVMEEVYRIMVVAFAMVKATTGLDVVQPGAFAELTTEHGNELDFKNEPE